MQILRIPQYIGHQSSLFCLRHGSRVQAGLLVFSAIQLVGRTYLDQRGKNDRLYRMSEKAFRVGNMATAALSFGQLANTLADGVGVNLFAAVWSFQANVAGCILLCSGLFVAYKVAEFIYGISNKAFEAPPSFYFDNAVLLLSIMQNIATYSLSSFSLGYLRLPLLNGLNSAVLNRRKWIGLRAQQEIAGRIRVIALFFRGEVVKPQKKKPEEEDDRCYLCLDGYCEQKSISICAKGEHYIHFNKECFVNLVKSCRLKMSCGLCRAGPLEQTQIIWRSASIGPFKVAFPLPVSVA